MNYEQAREAFFAPRPGAVDQTGWQSPARRLRDAVEPLATVSFWAEPAYDAYAALGLDFLTGYVWSRSSVLGTADAGVVAATFGVFEPAAVAALLEAARASCSLEQVREARERGAAASLRAAIGEPEQLAETADALLEAVLTADLAGRPLFAGAAGLPVPADPHARLWHAATLARECRGDSHLGACVAAGLTGLEACLLTELWVGYEPLAYTASRAWSPEAMSAAQAALRDRGLLDGDALSPQGRVLRERVESATDQALAPVVTALGDRLEEVLARCEGWGQALVDRGWFPPDAYKRAAG